MNSSRASTASPPNIRYQPQELSQGCLKILRLLEQCLLEITGMDAITLQPAAGAQGELTGLLLIRAYLEKQGNPRKKVLIPDSAHGTNPATAVIAGYEVENIKSESHGQIDVEKLRELVTEDVAALMITNPSTLGIFEERIPEIAEILHAKGALLYMDGANMNALAGVTRPGDLGVDVMHLNLHKTFSTPHGGGGPGAGPVAMKKILEPFRPVPILVEKEGGRLALEHVRPRLHRQSESLLSGNFGVLVRALAYILAYGPGVRQATEDAVLNANYIRKHLEGVFDLPYSLPSMHEVVFSDAHPKEKRRQHHGHRQAPDRLRLPSLHDGVSADRSRRADDRADRIGIQRRVRPLHRRHALASPKKPPRTPNSSRPRRTPPASAVSTKSAPPASRSCAGTRLARSPRTESRRSRGQASRTNPGHSDRARVRSLDSHSRFKHTRLRRTQFAPILLNLSDLESTLCLCSNDFCPKSVAS